jgi:DNA repair ATPase RecN
MQVKIENYQSIKHAEFEVKGLTVITGANNTGKSACARAIAGVFSNARGYSHVRKGEKSSKVSISFDDGSEVIWEKGKAINRYEINGRELEKVGSKTPDELEDLKVVSVDVDGKTVWPQIAKQFEQIFLLDMPPSVLSSALSEVKTIETLEKASSLSRSETRSINNRIKVKHEDLVSERDRLPSFHELSNVEETINHINNLEVSIKTLDEKVQKLNNIKNKREILMLQTPFISTLNTIQYPQVNPHDFMGIKDLEQIRKQKNKLLIMEGVVDVGLNSFPILPKIREVKDPTPLQRVLNKRNQLHQTIKSISALNFNLPEVNPQVEKDLEVATERFGLSLSILKVEQEVERLTEELEAIKCEIGDTCPLCEQGIDH